MADARYNLGTIHLLLGSSHDAHREFTGALEAAPLIHTPNPLRASPSSTLLPRQVHIEPYSEEAANLRYGLAMAEHQLGAHEAAYGHYHAARRVRAKIYGEGHPSVREIDLCLQAVREDTDARMARQLKSKRF